MHIRVASDLHTEFSDFEFYPLPSDKDTVLILAGDIMVVHHPKAFKRGVDLLSKCNEQFRKVIYIAGNHCHYHGSYNQTHSLIRNTILQHNLSNVHFLENESVIIDDVAFIGSTLWTDLDKGNPVHRQLAKMYMADYDLIGIIKGGNERKTLNPQDTYDAHVVSKKYIFKEITKQKKDGRKVVVVTHHGISSLSTHPRFKGDPLNGSFISELTLKIMDAKPDLWVHGHVHNCFQYNIGDTRVVVNPRGYPGEQGEFDDVLTVEI